MAKHRPTGLATARLGAGRALRKIAPFRTAWIPAELEHREISDAGIERNPVRVRSKTGNSCTLLLIPREAQASVDRRCPRSEEHTSELQSPYDLVCRLLLEKKKKKPITNTNVRYNTKTKP